MIRRQDDGGSRPHEEAEGEALSPLARTARLILEVVPGERKLLPEFGCRVHHLPSIATDADRGLAAALIEEALDLWAPSLRVDRADVISAEDGSIAIALRARGASHALTITHRSGRAPADASRDPAGSSGDVPGCSGEPAAPAQIRSAETGWSGRRS